MEVEVFEHNAPLLTFRLKKLQPGGSTIPYPLSGTIDEIALYGKKDPDDADSSALWVYKKSTGAIAITDNGTVSGQYSEITVQVSAANMTPPATLYYHLDVTKAGNTETVMADFWTIVNI